MVLNFFNHYWPNCFLYIYQAVKPSIPVKYKTEIVAFYLTKLFPLCFKLYRQGAVFRSGDDIETIIIPGRVNPSTGFVYMLNIDLLQHQILCVYL